MKTSFIQDRHTAHALRMQNAAHTQVQSHATHYASGLNLTYAWSFGSQILFLLIVQIFSGVVLSFYYNPGVDMAFESVDRIMTDINHGY